MEDITNKQTNSEEIKSYSDFVKSCEANGVTYTLSEEEYNEYKSGKLKFVPIATIMNVGRGIAGTVVKNADRLTRAANRGPEALVKETTTIMAEEGLSAARGFVTTKMTMKNSNNGAGGGGGNSVYRDGDVGGSNRLLGQFDTNPMNLDLKPGILNRSYAELLNEPTDKYNYLNITQAAINMPDDDKTDYFYTNVLVPWMQNKAQSAVNFAVDLSIISDLKLRVYLNNVCSALNVYYFNTSIIAYCNLPNNRDLGMRSLRSMISSEDIDYLTQLKGLLSSIAIPPNLNSACFFFNENFNDGEVGNGLFKIMPISFNASSDTVNGEVNGFNGTNSSVIKNVIELLNSSDNRKVASLLSRIAPNWVNPNIYDPSAVPIYSRTAQTIFANLSNRVWATGSSYYGPTFTDYDTNLSYVSFDPNLDGIALACFSPFKSGYPSISTPTVMRPITSVMVSTSNWYCNRFSYIYSTSLSRNAWLPSNLRIESAFSRNDKSRIYQGTTYYGRLSNSLEVSGVTPRVCIESAKDFLSWMLSVDTIPTKSKTDKSWSSRKSTTKDKVQEKK